MKLHDIVIARSPFWTQVHIKHTVAPNPTGATVSILKPDLMDNVDWKRREAGDKAVDIYEFGRSLAWGKVRTAIKLGCRMKFIEIGGLELNAAGDLCGLLNVVFKKAGVLFCYISLNEENEYFQLFRMRREKHSPVIIRDLSNFESQGMQLNFFGGMRDTY